MRRQLFYDPLTLRQLTPREATVLSAAKDNKTIDDIAESLCIAQPVVMRHLSNIVSKLHETDVKLEQKLLFSYNLDVAQHSQA